MAFSIQSNMKKLLSNNDKTAEFCGINILKIFSCLMILFGHRIMYIGANPLYNINKMEEVSSISYIWCTYSFESLNMIIVLLLTFNIYYVFIVQSYSIMIYGIIHNGPLVVDIFFVLSGFLTFHGVHNHLVKTKRFNMPLILFLRWCR